MEVSNDLCLARAGAHATRIEKVEEALEAHTQTLSEVSQCLTRLTVLCEKSDEAISIHAEKIEALETRPARKWDTLITAFISSGAGAIAGALLTQLFS